MSDEPTNASSKRESIFFLQIASKAARKLKAQREGERGVWFGLGMTGLVGWSVAVPTVLGALLGIWLDRRHAGRHSWTLPLLVAGLVIGCANAWHWIVQQDGAIHDELRGSDG